MSRKLKNKALQFLKQEQGTIFKTGEGRLSVALAFPGVYSLGMSNLGFQIVYGILNSLPDVACERVFLPDTPELAEYRRSKTDLFTLESQKPVRGFDVLAFSLPFEMNALDLLEMLELSGIPILAAERDETHPLVLVGGAYATFNPEPLSDFVDLFLIGEAEEALPELTDILLQSQSGTRHNLLQALTRVQGVYVPQFYDVEYQTDGSISNVTATPPVPERVKRRKVSDLSNYDGVSVILTPNTEFSNMLLIEAIRGCGRQCRFCVSGYSGLPPRPRKGPPDGDSRVGLVGSAVFDHPEAQAICEKLTADGREFSVSSIRIESLTPELAEMMHRTGQKTMTLAPEAGTERLRNVINKPIGDDQVLQAAGFAANAGIRRLKLYFMIGLPTETEEDIESIARLAQRISEEHINFDIQLSVSCFVPKPWTPFQWCGMADEKQLSSKIRQIRKLLSGHKRIKLSAESPREAAAQAILARGDRRIGRALLTAHQNKIGLVKAAEIAGLDTSFYISRARDENEVFPWDHIDLLVRKSYLREEYCKALQGRTTPACVVGSCARCGVC